MSSRGSCEWSDRICARGHVRQQTPCSPLRQHDWVMSATMVGPPGLNMGERACTHACMLAHCSPRDRCRVVVRVGVVPLMCVKAQPAPLLIPPWPTTHPPLLPCPLRPRSRLAWEAATCPPQLHCLHCLPNPTLALTLTLTHSAHAAAWHGRWQRAPPRRPPSHDHGRCGAGPNDDATRGPARDGVEDRGAAGACVRVLVSARVRVCV